MPLGRVLQESLPYIAYAYSYAEYGSKVDGGLVNFEKPYNLIVLGACAVCFGLSLIWQCYSCWDPVDWKMCLKLNADNGVWYCKYVKAFLATMPPAMFALFLALECAAGNDTARRLGEEFDVLDADVLSEPAERAAALLLSDLAPQPRLLSIVQPSPGPDAGGEPAVHDMCDGWDGISPFIYPLLVLSAALSAMFPYVKGAPTVEQVEELCREKGYTPPPETLAQQFLTPTAKRVAIISVQTGYAKPKKEKNDEEAPKVVQAAKAEAKAAAVGVGGSLLAMAGIDLPSGGSPSRVLPPIAPS